MKLQHAALIAAAIFLFSIQAHAACSPTAGADGQTITCNGTDTSGNVGGDFNDIRITVNSGATLAATTAGNIEVGSNARITNNGTIHLSTGFYSIVIDGDGSTVINNGTMDEPVFGTAVGIFTTHDNTTFVNNGAVSGNAARVFFGGTSAVTNNGTITYTADDGADLVSQESGGSFVNTGTMTAAARGALLHIVNIGSGSNSVVNSGTMESTDGDGVDFEMLVAGDNTFNNSGSISTISSPSARNGVLVNMINAGISFAGTNTGTISADGDEADGLYLHNHSTGSMTFANSGAILANGLSAVGAEIDGAATLTNASGGQIFAFDESIGVLMENNNPVFVNQQGGNVEAGLYSVAFCDCTTGATVTNSGTMLSALSGFLSGVLIEPGAENDTFTNTATGVMTGSVIAAGSSGNVVTNHGVWNFRLASNDPGDFDFILAGAGNTFDTSDGIVRVFHTGALVVAPVTYPSFIDRTDEGAGTVIGLSAGTPAALQSADALLLPALVADGNDFDLLLFRRAFTDPAGGTLSPAAHRIAAILENTFAAAEGDPSGSLGTLDASLQNLSFTAYSAALHNMQGGVHASAGVNAATVMGAGFQNLLQQRMDGLFEGNGGAFAQNGEVQVAYAGDDFAQFVGDNFGKSLSGASVWVRGHGVTADIGSMNGESGLNVSGGGVGLGADERLDAHRVAGFAFDYNDAKSEMTDNSSAYDRINSYKLAAYGGWNEGPWQLTGLVDFAYDDNSSWRAGIAAPSITANYGAEEIGAAVEADYLYDLDGGVRLRPNAGLAYQGYFQNGFSESGGGAQDLMVKAQDFHSLQPSIGLRADKDYDYNGAAITPELHAKLQYDVLDQDREVTASLGASPGTFFTSSGVKPGAFSTVIGAGLTAALSKDTHLFLSYDAEIHSNFTANTFAAGLKWEF